MAKKSTTRAATAARRSGPGLKKARKEVVVVDLTKPNARKALEALHPQPLVSTMLDATPLTDQAAIEYIAARDAATVASGKKEVAGNMLCQAIGDATGIVGDGWKATWAMANGTIDWEKVCQDFNIPAAALEKYRRPSARRLDVREVAEETSS